ncbi:PTS sugar transporter subunit IIA [Intestinibacter sp.]|uniref:PTS sugar transporter subunit IIA n=1 Tax=Intestinibacter sp. TaxID=1965304 RepID=UPI003F169E23
MSSNEYVVISGNAKNEEEAIRMCGEALLEKGYVGESFISGCIEREKEYPTGLPTDIPVAIPHCKSSSVEQNSICLLKLDEPVVFYRMDDAEECIKTDMIFNLAIKDANDHLGILQKLMQFVSDSDALIECKGLSNSESIKFLKEKIG